RFLERRSRFGALVAGEVTAPERDVRRRLLRVARRRGFEVFDGAVVVAATLVDAAAQEVRFRVVGDLREDVTERLERFGVVARGEALTGALHRFPDDGGIDRASVSPSRT